jgi:hypothetical protein
MAYEAVLVTRIEDPIDFTVADGTAIAKGQVLKLAAGRVGITTSAATDPIAGIAAREKAASDGRTQLSVYQRGVFRMYLSGTVTVGDPVTTFGVSPFNNYVIKAAITSSGAVVLGYALDSGTNGQQKEIMLSIGTAGTGVA